MNTRKAFRKFATSVTITLLLAGWNASPAHAGHLNFTLYNESSKAIVGLYVSPARSDNWGQDVLGRGVLLSGEHTRITFPGQNPSSPCIWDIKIIYKDGTRAQKRFNLCEVRSINAR